MHRTFRLALVFGTLLLLAGIIQVSPALAAGIVVNTNVDNSISGDKQCTLREAINNANAGSDTSGGDCAAGTGNDVITFTVSGTITLTKVLPTLKVPMTIQGPGPTLDAGGDDTILRVNAPSGKVVITSMNFTNGTCNASRNGGGALTNLTKLTINGGEFTNNNASSCDGGGAIRNQSGTLRINGTRFAGNTAAVYSGSGGAILNLGTLSITNNSKFTGNKTYYGGAIANLTGATVSVNQATFRSNRGWGYGGAIYNKGEVYIDTAVLDQNDTGVSGYGGGIANLSGLVQVANSTFSEGYGKRGGALYTEDGTATLIANTMVGNQGWGSGGAIYATGTQVSITNSTFTQNATDGEYGGTIFTETNNLYVTNSTFAANTCVCPEDGGAAGILANGSLVTLQNTILADYWGDGNNYDCAGDGFLADKYNLAFDEACDDALIVTPDTIQLGTLQDNGGPTQTIKPRSGSAAIDAGNDAICAAAWGSPNYGANGVDQRGIKRPQGSHCDVGAYEVRSK